MGGHERGEPADDFGVAAETEQRLDLVLCRARPQLLEPLDLGPGEVVEGKLPSAALAESSSASSSI